MAALPQHSDVQATPFFVMAPGVEVVQLDITNGNSMADLSCTICIGSRARCEGRTSNIEALKLTSQRIAAIEAELDMVTGSTGPSRHAPALTQHSAGAASACHLGVAALGELQLL